MTDHEQNNCVFFSWRNPRLSSPAGNQIRFLHPPPFGSRLSCYQETWREKGGNVHTTIESVDSKDLWVKKALWLINSKQTKNPFQFFPFSLFWMRNFCFFFVCFFFFTCRVTIDPAFLCQQISWFALESRIFQLFNGDFFLPPPVGEARLPKSLKKSARNSFLEKLEMAVLFFSLGSCCYLFAKQIGTGYY